MGVPVVHFEIGGSDAERSRRFYTELFGWTVRVEPGTDYGLVNTGAGEGIDGGIMEMPEGTPPWITVYVSVDDLEKYLGRAEELGAQRLMGPVPVGEVGAMAMFADPDGNVVGLWRPAASDGTSRP